MKLTTIYEVELLSIVRGRKYQSCTFYTRLPTPAEYLEELEFFRETNDMLAEGFTSAMLWILEHELPMPPDGDPPTWNVRAEHSWPNGSITVTRRVLISHDE